MLANGKPDRLALKRALGVKVWSVPMRTRFRGITVREGVLLRGAAGWGEWSPFLEYDDAVAEPWLRCAEEAAAGDWPTPLRDAVPVNVTVPAVGPEQAHAIVTPRRLPHRQGQGRRARADPGRRPGPAGGGPRRARPRRAGPHRRQRALGRRHGGRRASRSSTARPAAWSTSSSPCASVEELAVVRRRVDVPIAADESIRRAADPYRVRDLEAADVAVLKVQPLGGVRACLRIAEDIGLPVVVSSALETSVGIAAGVALAAALPELPYACGLATVQLLERDVVTDPLLPVDGMLPVRVPIVDESLLGADPDRVAHWEARLAAVRAVRQDRRP